MDRRWKVLAIATVAVFAVYLDTTVVTIAFPSVERSFPHVSRAGLSWVLNSYNIVLAALLVPAGRVADAIGLRRAFMIGVGGFVVTSLLSALMPTPATLVAMRVLQAAAAALVAPTSRGLLLAEFPPAERATAVGIWAAGGATAASLGPPIGGALVDLHNWRLVFLVNLPLGLITLVAARRLLVERRTAGARLPDFLGVALVTAAIGCLALGIVQGRTWGWTSAATLAAFAAAAAIAPLAALRAARHPAGAIDLSLFRIRSFAVGNAGTLLYATGLFAILLANVLFLTSVWHYSILKAGLALVPTAVMTTLVAVPAGRFADRHGQRRLIVVGSVVFAAGIGWYAHRVGSSPHYLRDWLPGAILSGTGTGLAFPALASASVAGLPLRQLGLGSAVNSACRQIGAVLGVAALVAIVGTPTPAGAVRAFDAGWTFIGAAGLAGGLVVLAFWPAPARERAPAAAAARSAK